MSKTLILTHADLDGMVSGILLLAGLEPDAMVRVTNGAKLAASITSELSALGLGRNVYIADIPLDRACVEEVYTALQALAQNGCSIHLYDHHLGWNEPDNVRRFGALFATYDVDERKTTAAALVWRDFLRCDPAYQRWLELVSRKDKSSDHGVADDFRLLAALMQHRHAHRRNEAMRSLAIGGSMEDRQEIIDWYTGSYLPRQLSLAEGAEVFETRSGRRIGWVDLRDEDDSYPGISKMTIECHSTDLAASVIYSGVLVGGISIDKRIDLSFLHGHHVSGGIELEAVGHKSPLRIRPMGTEVDTTFVGAAKALIIDKI